MDEQAMTNAELALIQKLAQAMGYSLDELGHPYRLQPATPENGQDGYRCLDFNPMRDAADAMRVQVFFNLNMECEADVIIVREGKGPLLMIYTIDDLSAEGRLLAACVAVCSAAGVSISRLEMRQLAGAI